MKINFPALFQASLSAHQFFLIYGNDASVIERTLAFLRHTFSSSLLLKTEDDFLKNPCPEPSLFEKEDPSCLNLISPATDKILTVLEKCREGKFVFVSEKARAQSKLVTTFSQKPSCIAIAAYASPLIPPEFDRYVEGLKLAPSFKSLLFKTYQNDYLGLLATLKKIHLYGEVPEEHYDDFLRFLSPSVDISPLLHSFLLKDQKKAMELFSLVVPSETISFCRRLSRSFQTLLELLPFRNFPQRIPWQTLTYPVFFKEQPLYEKALSKWASQDVCALLETLLQVEKRAKTATLNGPYPGCELLRFLTF